MNRSKQSFILLSVCITLSLFVAGLDRAEHLKRQKWPGAYKKTHRDTISRIVDGRYDDAITYLQDHLNKHPNDLESLYSLTIAYAQKQNIDTAMKYLRQAVDAGLDFGRFLAGPRSLLKPLTDSNEFQQFAKAHHTELLHGPVLGCVTESSAKFWVRTANEVPVQVIVSESEKMDSAVKSAIVKTSKDNDFTAVLSIDGLKPRHRYYYELLVNGERQPKQWSFRTFILPGWAAKFQVGFGGGAGYTPQHERMWNTIASYNLPAFLFLGDNVYIDHPLQPEVQQYCYYRRQGRPEFRSFAAATSVYAIYDDHDFADNDSIGGPDIDQPPWKRAVWKVFSENWNNPYYGGGQSQPGCWFDFAIGDVDFFMLDGRYYRTDPQQQSPSMLGPVQKKWLLEKLKASKATFKVLAGPVPWSFGAKPVSQRTSRGMVPGGLDTWEGFKDEREQIFSFIEENNIGGVVLLSADRHRSDAWKIERPNGYDFYEFESSRLTNVHMHSLLPQAMFGYNDKCSFGLLNFDTTAPDPLLTYQIVNIDNEIIHTFSLRRSQLTPGKTKTESLENK